MYMLSRVKSINLEIEHSGFVYFCWKFMKVVFSLTPLDFLNNKARMTIICDVELVTLQKINGRSRHMVGAPIGPKERLNISSFRRRRNTCSDVTTITAPPPTGCSRRLEQFVLSWFMFLDITTILFYILYVV